MNDPRSNRSADDARELFARAVVFGRRTLRFWPTLLSFVGLGAVLCGLLLHFRKPTYRSETVILYSGGVRLPDDAEHGDSARSVALRLKELLTSRVALEGVIREFGLYPDIRRKLGPIDAVEELRRHIAFRAPGGDTFGIAFTGSSPEEAERVTAHLGALVIGQDSELRRNQALATRDFLVAEERTTETGLRAREEELASFMAAHPRFAFDATPLSTGTAIRASHGATVVAEATPAPAARAWSGPSPGQAAPRDTGPPSPASGAGSRELTAEVQRATAAVAAARANLAELTTHFTAAHPDVRAAEAELARETSRLATATAAAHGAAERTAADTESARPRASEPVPVRPARLPVVVTPVPAVPSSAAAAGAVPERDVVALETDWVRLTRAVTEARQHQDQIEAALFKANMAASAEPGGHGVEVTVIDPAFLPVSPVPPSRTTIVALFLAGSLLLGMLAAMLRTLFDDRVYGPRDVDGLVVALAEVPRASRRVHVGS